MNRSSALLNFLNSSPSPHHVVEVSKQALIKAGYIQLFEGDSWKDRIRPAGKYFITRNGTSIVAMSIERDYVRVGNEKCSLSPSPLLTSLES